jgi:hypothetical protein
MGWVPPFFMKLKKDKKYNEAIWRAKQQAKKRIKREIKKYENLLPNRTLIN